MTANCGEWSASFPTLWSQNYSHILYFLTKTTWVWSLWGWTHGIKPKQSLRRMMTKAFWIDRPPLSSSVTPRISSGDYLSLSCYLYCEETFQDRHPAVISLQGSWRLHTKLHPSQQFQEWERLSHFWGGNDICAMLRTVPLRTRCQLEGPLKGNSLLRVKCLCSLTGPEHL